MAAESILQKIARGDRDAVEECLDRYGGLVWSMARRLCRTQDEAEDAVQDIFVELWRSAGKFDPAKASEKGFIAMITRRRLIDRIRRAAARPAGEELNVETQAPATAAPDPVGAAAVAALAELKPEQRQVVELSVIHGYTHSEIAEKIAMPLGTVKTHCRRGLLKLRDLLSGSPIAGEAT